MKPVREATTAEDYYGTAAEQGLALDEEGEAPQLSTEQIRPSNDPTHRRLRAMAGAGNAYLFIVIPGDETEQTTFDYAGLYPDAIPSALRQLAALVDAA